MASAATKLRLNSGYDMPRMGLGTWKSKPSEVESAVRTALDIGYRHLDCAHVYQNESEVGQALKDKLAEGKVKREDLFITSKLWNTGHTPCDVKPHLKQSLKNLGLNYLDLYLIHFPQSLKPGKELFPADKDGNSIHVDIDPADTWKAMEECVDEGLVRSIGLSNFNSEQIEHIISKCRIRPAVNQVEIHPYFAQTRLVDFCKERDIAVTAYSPLGSNDRPDIFKASPDEPTLLDDPKLKELADKYKRSPAQIILRWLLQRDIIVIPKSVNQARIKENFETSDFKLSEVDMMAMKSFDRDMRLTARYVYEDGKKVFYDRKVPHFPFNIDF